MNNNTPKIALGTWSWGVGAVGGDQVFGNHLGEAELRPVFDAAMKAGLNFWDTAVVYGMGASEDILGTFAKTYSRKDVLLSTKFTPDIAGESENPVEEMCNSSLKRLGTDFIDLYWIHNPGDVEKWTPGLIPLVKSGKVKRAQAFKRHILTKKPTKRTRNLRKAAYLTGAEGKTMKKLMPYK